jgi:glycosyltransferase involved in cell wall biosynthesis
LSENASHGGRPAPAVTVGIPTYNRAAGLQRALESVLGQSEQDLEVIVSDNASTDETPQIVAQAIARDERIRYLRHDTNQGLTANFNAVLEAARGQYAMVLADDDWIEADYVARCRATLDADRQLALVCGSPIYHEPDGNTFAGVEIDLLDPDPSRRVRRYFAKVTDNVCIYGLIRRELIDRVLPMRNCLAGDWLLIARLAFLGCVRTDRDTHVHRSTDGASASLARTVRRLGLSEFEERHPHLAIMRFIHADIAHDCHVYASLSPARRQALALACAAQIVRTRPGGLVIEELLQRPPLRLVYDILPGRASPEDSV